VPFDDVVSVSPEIKAELLRELALEVAQPHSDIGVRAGLDALHPTHRGKPVVSFACWDLLGIHGNPEAAAAMVRGAEEFGIAANVARLSGGIHAPLTQSETRIAKFFVAESALIFSTRNQAVLTTITALCGEGVVVMGTPLSSLPLADACALVGGDFVEFDGESQLRAELQKYGLARRVVVVIEGVSAISGQVAPLQHLLTAIEHVGAWAIIDETNALGWSGIRGAGSAEIVPSHPSILGRIVGFQGVAGSEVCALVSSQELRELLISRSRYLKQEPPPPAATLRFLTTLVDTVEVALSQRDKLAARSLMVNRSVKAQGWKVVGTESSPILSLWFDTLHSARTAQEALLQRGVLVEALAARSLRRNGAVIRALLSNLHTQEEVLILLSSLDEVRKRIDKATASM